MPASDTPATIHGFELQGEGEHAGLPLGHHGLALLTLRHKRDGASFWLFVPREWPDLIEWRELTAAAAAVHKEDDHTSSWTGKAIVPPARYVVEPGNADALRAALAWAEDWRPEEDWRARNGERMALVAGAHGHFALERDETRGRYLVRCDYGRQSPLKRIGAWWSGEAEAWVAPWELEDELEAVLVKAARGVKKTHAAAEGGRRALPEVRGVKVAPVDKGFEVSFAYDAAMVARFREVKTARWDRERKLWTVGAAGYKGLLDFLAAAPGLLRRKAEADAEERRRLDAEREARERRWAEEKAERQRTWEKEREVERTRREASRPEWRALYPLDRLPPVGTVLREYGGPVTVTGHGKTVRITEDDPSVWGSDLLGHEGERGAFAYGRPATADEIATLELLEAEAKAARERRALAARLKDEAEKAVQAAGDVPPGTHSPEGERVLDTQNIYGGGSWFVIGEEHVWFVRNHGMDGDDWSANNVRTGGAGAVGWRAPRTDALVETVRKAAEAAS